MFSCSVLSDALRRHGLQHARLPCPSPLCSNSRPLSWWCHPTVSASVVSFSSNLSEHQVRGRYKSKWFLAMGHEQIDTPSFSRSTWRAFFPKRFRLYIMIFRLPDSPIWIRRHLFVIPLYIPNITFQSRQWHPTPVLLPGKSHGWRILVGCSPWGREESDMTERLHFHFSLSCTGEGNATHSSVLAWRIPGTGEPGGLSRTRLKRLSSSSSNNVTFNTLSRNYSSA